MDLIAYVANLDSGARKSARRMEVSSQAIFGGEEVPMDVNLMVNRKQAAELLQLSTWTIDILKREGRMPQPCRIGRAVRWNRDDLVAWVDAGCPSSRKVKDASRYPRIAHKLKREKNTGADMNHGVAMK